MGWLFGRNKEVKSSKDVDEVVKLKTGPWDFNDEDAPDFSDYLDFGSIYIPYFQGIELRVKKQRENGQVIGATVTYGSSSVEVEAFAAPKSTGIWNEVCKDLLDGNSQACTAQGEFGTELLLPVKVGEKSITTRIVGVDGPRWMLRGVFSGPAATELAENNNETKQLDEWFKGIVVNRGEEPLAPRDLIPMHEPLTREEKESAQKLEENNDESNSSSEENADDALKKEDKPLGYDQQVDVKTTLSRGPMFSEVR
ncbi:DUF3710 domain-containing protein [Gardnerella vaginalis]|uniref:DUF3710 domain-containing protein n=1 Tax=Gardnerella TaxID=2701 RepID=UPI001FF1D859|nr:DUF3710 domain-containing protein [Gardnerella vaginalis]